MNENNERTVSQAKRQSKADADNAQQRGDLAQLQAACPHAQTPKIVRKAGKSSKTRKTRTDVCADAAFLLRLIHKALTADNAVIAHLAVACLNDTSEKVRTKNRSEQCAALQNKENAMLNKMSKRTAKMGQCRWHLTN